MWKKFPKKELWRCDIWITSMNNNSQLWPVQSSHGTRLKPQNVGLTVQMLDRIWIPTHLAISSLKTALEYDKKIP